MVRALCFDLDGTLGGYAGGFASFLAWLRHEVAPDGDPARFVEVVKDELHRDGPVTLESALKRALLRLGQRPPLDLGSTARAFVRAYAEDVRPAPGAAELLGRLRGAGVPLALVSNGPVDMQRSALRALGFEELFDTVLVSGDPEVGARKPAARIFSLACAALAAPPAETLMVGDSPASDVGGARAYGMQAVLLGPEAEGERLGVPAAADVPRLDALLRRHFGL